MNNFQWRDGRYNHFIVCAIDYGQCRYDYEILRVGIIEHNLPTMYLQLQLNINCLEQSKNSIKKIIVGDMLVTFRETSNFENTENIPTPAAYGLESHPMVSYQIITIIVL